MSRIRRNATLSAVYPVGSVYITVSSTLPAAIAAIGTWEQMATGKTLWNVDPTVTAPGTEIEAGLPNITGSVSTPCMYGGFAGAFIAGGGVTQAEPYEGQSASSLQFNAASSNGIYGKSDTVQPPAIAVTMWKRTK